MIDHSKVFKYCPRCGEGLKPQEHDRQMMPTCINKQCGFIFWQTSSPTVAAIILNSNEQVLYTRRAIDPDKGKLDLPGGFLQYGELPEVGMKREALEEIGVEIEIMNIIGFVMDRYYYQDIMMRNLVIGMEAKILGDDPVIGDSSEIAEIVWCDVNSIKSSDLAVTYNEKLLMLFKLRNTKQQT